MFFFFVIFMFVDSDLNEFVEVEYIKEIFFLVEFIWLFYNLICLWEDNLMVGKVILVMGSLFFVGLLIKVKLVILGKDVGEEM